jgi:2,3-bisphosphoglycerate-independent phosphoglycerate mutase
MRAMRRILMIFVDGVGLGEADSAINPLVRARTPAFRALLGRPLAGREAIRTSAAVMVPLDARLGVPGLPQSATGQTALLTGENAPALIGRHITAYPTPTLSGLLQSRGLFSVLRARGVSAALANAYSAEYFAAVAGRRIRHAAITLNALQAGVRLRGIEDLRAGRAVSQDLTNARVRERESSVPLVTPEDAGRTLAAVGAEHEFTLFEFFQTDLAGHGRVGDPVGVVERFDRFVGAALGAIDLEETLVLLTSDHGNLEDGRTNAHTLNPVPALLAGAGREEVAARLGALTDVAPACLDVLSAGRTVS